MNSELVGTFIEERRRFPSRFEGQSDCIIGSIRSDKLQTIKGEADFGELKKGLEYRFFGYFKDYRNPSTGKTESQFCFNSFVESAPAGREAIIGYIVAAGEGFGLGRARADRLYREFGEDAVKKLREDPQACFDLLSKRSLPVALESLEAVAEILRSKFETEAVQIELTALLSGRGFPRTTTRAAIQVWGTRAARIIRRDPYRLMAFHGTGFRKCDQMYLDLGLPRDRMKRQALCAWYAIASDSEGHSWFRVEKAANYIRETISGANLDIEKALRLAIRAKAIAEDFSKGVAGPIVKSAEGIRWIAEGAKAKHEQQIAEIVAKAASGSVHWPKAEEIEGLSNHQGEELSKALTSPIAILGGSPGTGKTYTAGQLIKKLGEAFGLDNILICAPTGKAAVRLTENLVRLGLEVKARTTDSWLNWLDRQKDTTVFPHSVIVVDETSMHDTDKLAALLRGMNRGAHLLLIGDIHQLPPVGHGAPLRDLIAAGVSYGELREIIRNSGGIVEACAAIRDGRQWSAGDNLFISEDGSPEKQVETMLSICRQAKAAGLDPVWDVQVIAAVNEKSPLARTKLNEILQRELNLSAGKAGQAFRLFDKVVNLENAFFDLIVEKGAVNQEGDFEKRRDSSKPEAYVANGELARVVKVEESHLIVELSAPKRVIKVPRGKSKQAAGDPIDVEKTSSGCTFDLGYGLTCHKMQGSSAKWVVVLLDTYPGALRVASREWLYTAISRAESKCFLVGKKATAERMVRNVSLQKRKTFLKERVLIERARLLLEC